MVQPVKILFAGTPAPAAQALRALLADDRLEVVAVITQPDAAKGRGRTLHPSPVAEVAREHGLDTHKWPSLKQDADSGAEVREQFRSYADAGVQAIAVVAYGNLIPADLLGVVPQGWINLHYSLLPRWRGAAPVQAAIAAGDAITGTSTFRIGQGLDTGPVIATATRPITDTDTTADLLEALTDLGGPLLADSLVDLAHGTAELSPQDDAAATHAPKIASADAEIDWRAPAEVIQRRARAHSPAPGAWSMLEGKRFKLGLMRVVDKEDSGGDATPAIPGTLYSWDGSVFVTTGTTPVEVLQVQPPGKKMMAATDWARGQQQLVASQPTFTSTTQEG
ncbi:MAG TPA: methionyl-tRNA formyltransferase [Candidatus Corynebacterium gallistercoris]|uniref:Methionyl-tRNA formyltransferase n=1 Tax=Candidatus Corynebacterium gallistercoris TaxID=2838530 RepID=A0A9D1RZ20_9CORY|nr:methionyl-tRNA formyltransferase [Candidatus Corynebacterium gallistercoris]